MAKSKLSKKMLKEIEGFFKPEEIEPLPFSTTEWPNKYLIKLPSEHSPEYRKREYLVWQCNGGWGCEEGKISNAIYCTCLADKETAKHYPGQFIGVFVGDIEAYKEQIKRPILAHQLLGIKRDWGLKSALEHRNLLITEEKYPAKVGEGVV